MCRRILHAIILICAHLIFIYTPNIYVFLFKFLCTDHKRYCSFHGGHFVCFLYQKESIPSLCSVSLTTVLQWPCSMLHWLHFFINDGISHWLFSGGNQISCLIFEMYGTGLDLSFLFLLIVVLCQSRWMCYYMPRHYWFSCWRYIWFAYVIDE